MISALVLAAALSATAPADVPDDEVWPRLTLKGTAGLPTWVGLGLEVNVLDGIGVEGGMSAPGIIEGSYTLGGYWRPLAFNTPSWDLRLGLGAQIFAFYDASLIPFSQPDGLVVLSGQATAAWRPLASLPVGLFAGLRLGLGPAFSFSGTGIEPGGVFELNLGVVIF